MAVHTRAVHVAARVGGRLRARHLLHQREEALARAVFVRRGDHVSSEHPRRPGDPRRDAISEFRQLAQLLGGERGLQRPAAAEDVHSPDGAGGQRLEGMLGDVGARELVDRFGEYARHVERHIAVADHHRRLRVLEAEVVGDGVGVAVVPLDERSSGVDASQVLAGQAKSTVRFRAVREYYCIVLTAQSREWYMHSVAAAAAARAAGARSGTDVHITQEACTLGRSDLSKPLGHVLHLLVVRRHAEAHQPERYRQAVEDVDVDIGIFLQEEVGGVEAGWAASNYRNAPRRGAR